MLVAKSFKHVRISNNLSQAELAEMVGCTKQNISDIERGFRMPSAKVIIAMAKKLGCTADEILGIEKLNDMRGVF